MITDNFCHSVIFTTPIRGPEGGEQWSAIDCRTNGIIPLGKHWKWVISMESEVSAEGKKEAEGCPLFMLRKGTGTRSGYHSEVRP